MVHDLSHVSILFRKNGILGYFGHFGHSSLYDVTLCDISQKRPSTKALSQA